MSGETILVVDDETAIRRLLKGALKRDGYSVVEAENARAAVAAIDIDKPAAVLLDLGLPDREGMELVPIIKARGLALLVISAREATAEKVAALDLGADDYVTKPFDTDEVLARVRSALRQRTSKGSMEPVVQLGNVTIDLSARLVTRNGQEVHLRPKEYELLAALARFRGKVVTHRHLLLTIWGPAHEHDSEYLRVAARGLRKKLEDDPAMPRLIRNEPAVGYRLVDPAQSS
jgi:two-component system KDP operon response regulator KdpE